MVIRQANGKWGWVFKDKGRVLASQFNFTTREEARTAQLNWLLFSPEVLPDKDDPNIGGSSDLSTDGS